MDPTAIAASAVTLLVPLIKKAAQEFAGAAGKSAFEKAKGLFARLKNAFSKDPAAADTIARFEKEPERYEPFMQDIIRDKMMQDPKLANEITQLLEQIKREAPTIHVVQKMKKAEEMIGVKAKEISRGDITVEQEADEAMSVTGVKSEKIS